MEKKAVIEVINLNKKKELDFLSSGFDQTEYDISDPFGMLQEL